MGKVYVDGVGMGLKTSYPSETVGITSALIMPGQVKVDVKLAELSEEEADLVLKKADILANSYQNEAIATAVAESANAIIDLVRWVKEETKESFMGMRGSGASLDLALLIPKMVGDSTIMNKDGLANRGLYGGASGGVYNWLKTDFVANTAVNYIPEQTMVEEAGVLHICMIDTIDVPKINRCMFILAGIKSSAQPLNFNFVDGSSLAMARFELPVMVGPEKKQQLQLMPYIDGASKPELVSIVVARAQDLTFTTV